MFEGGGGVGGLTRQPIYAQIKRWILGQIESGALREGSTLTPEQELADRFGVSRPTVRQAILELVHEGVLARVRGRGTTVLPRRLVYPVGRLLSFTEEFAGQGHELTSDVLGCTPIAADRKLAERLGGSEGEPVFALTRLRRVDAEPVALQHSYIAHRYVPGIEALDFSRASLYRVLAERYGFEIEHADELIRAGIAERSEASRLGIDRGTPIYRIERRSYVSGGRLIEVVDSVYRGDFYEIRLRLRH